MQTNLPLTYMAILVQSPSASSIEWVVNTTALELILSPYWIVFHRNLREIGSTPVLGSSKNYIHGLPIKAIETQSLRLFPPDKF